VNVKRVIAWLLLAFVIFFIVTQPETSADMVRSAFRGLSNAASGFANFVTSLF
jgi:large-conductance mechanosensitive channel